MMPAKKLIVVDVILIVDTKGRMIGATIHEANAQDRDGVELR
jgi:hypothetical protein